jgi:hypothetical protein
MKGRLKAVWELVDSWKQEEPSKLRKPIPPALIRGYFLFGLFMCREHLRKVRSGKTFHPRFHMRRAWRWLGFAIVVRLGFWGILRPSEAVSIGKHNVRIIGGSKRIGSAAGGLEWGSPNVRITEARKTSHSHPKAFLRIDNAKNRRFLGATQFASIPDGDTALWLEWAVDGAAPGEVIFPESSSVLRDCMRKANVAFGLEPSAFTPGGIRSSGATSRYLEHSDTTKLLHEMRLTSEKTLLHYLQLLMGEFVSTSLPLHVVFKLEELEKDVGEGYEAPPPISRQVLFFSK